MVSSFNSFEDARQIGDLPQRRRKDTTYLKPPASLYLLVTENIENHEQNALKKGIMFQSHQPHTDVPLKDEWGRNGRKDEQETPLGWEFEQ